MLPFHFRFFLSMTLLFLLVTTAHAKAKPTEIRKWTDTEGRTLEARFLRAMDENVVLKLRSGKVMKVPIRSLSQADHDYVVQQVKATRKPGEKFRNWVDQQGRVAEAEFVRVFENNVVLRKRGGKKVISVPMGALIESDQRYVVVLLFGESAAAAFDLQEADSATEQQTPPVDDQTQGDSAPEEPELSQADSSQQDPEPKAGTSPESSEKPEPVKLEQEQPPAELPPKPEMPPLPDDALPGMRYWFDQRNQPIKSKNGKPIIARHVGMDWSYIFLLGSNEGRSAEEEHKIPREQLSEEDRDFIRSEFARRRIEGHKAHSRRAAAAQTTP